jgi:hypothetical protein
MSPLLDLRLIRFYGFYLGVSFLLSTVACFRQYRAILGLVRSVPGRWPRLLKLVLEHLNLFLTWQTLLPLFLTLGLLLANTLAKSWLWPEADEFTTARLLDVWPMLPLVAVCGVGMVGMDVFQVWRAGQVDRAQLEKYFDQAEYWLRSWAAPVVHVFTFGYVNPRQMVAKEVRTALESASRMLNTSLWWGSLQTGLRITCGLSLWTAWALEPWLKRMLQGP